MKREICNILLMVVIASIFWAAWRMLPVLLGLDIGDMLDILVLATLSLLAAASAGCCWLFLEDRFFFKKERQEYNQWKADYRADYIENAMFEYNRLNPVD